MKSYLKFSICCFIILLIGACSQTKKLADQTVVFKEHKTIRLKISILEGYSNESDKLTANDQFATVVYGKTLILTTPVNQDQNSTSWQNQFVIFDYNTDSSVCISQLDDDYAYHDVLSQQCTVLRPGELKIKGVNSQLLIRVEEVNEPVQTTNNAIPSNTNLGLFLASIKANRVLADKENLKAK